MRWGLDDEFAPDLSMATAYRDLGYEWIAGYLGGRTPNPWTLEDWRTCRAAGLEVLPIWVAPLEAEPGYDRGVADGNAALARMMELGLSGVVVLDVENGLVPVEYMRGFVDAAHAGQCEVVLYGGSRTLRAAGDTVDAWWLAYWPVSGQLIEPAPADFTYWQFADGRVTDYNVCVDEARFAELEAG